MKLLCHLSCPLRAPKPIADCGSWEESRALILGRSGASPSWSPEIAHSICPYLQNTPGRKQGLCLTDEEMDAQRGAGTCPRSPSKVKDSPEYLREGSATVRERVGEADAPGPGPGPGEAQWALMTPSLPKGWGRKAISSGLEPGSWVPVQPSSRAQKSPCPRAASKPANSVRLAGLLENCGARLD